MLAPSSHWGCHRRGWRGGCATFSGRGTRGYPEDLRLYGWVLSVLMGGARGACGATLSIIRGEGRQNQGAGHITVARPWWTVERGAVKWAWAGVVLRAAVPFSPTCTGPAGRRAARPRQRAMEVSLRRAGGRPAGAGWVRGAGDGRLLEQDGEAVEGEGIMGALL